MKPTALSSTHAWLATYSDWWPPLLVVALVLAFWVAVFERTAHEDALVVQAALVNHSNVAQAMYSHTDQLLDRLRFYSRMLTGTDHRAMGRIIVRSALGMDKAFLRLMHFSADGRLLYSTGPRPEPWLIAAAKEYAATPARNGSGEIAVGTIPVAELSYAWSLPVFHRPPDADSDSFIVALLDLGHFPRRFEEFNLGKSGEIVLVADDGRELLRMNEGRLDSVGSVDGTKRLDLAFRQTSGVLIERGRDTHDRLYAYRRVPSSPLAVLISRTRYDVLLANKAAQRRYWLTASFLTLVMFVFTVAWLRAARRQRRLIRNLAQAKEDNARLIQQIGREKESIYHFATHDKLTGLANRPLFADLAARYLGRAQRLRGRFAVMFIDLDRFKPINDTFGHKVGDQVLVEVSRRLLECMRQTDVVARVGGDEFIALVADLRDSKDAALIAQKIVESLSHPLLGIVDGELKVTPSIGIAFYPDDSEAIEILVRQADAAMYQAKEQGRATFAFADPDLNRRNELRNQIEAALPEALRNHEIHVHYQPKVSLGDFRITGLEALARWNSPQLGAVSPEDFIPVAEECGAIVELGEYVFAEVCSQIDDWSRAGVPLVPVAVNVSPRQLRSPRLYDFIVSTLEQRGIEPRLLEIEITETGLIEVGDGLARTLSELNDLGINLAIDDFGTGFSGLSHLRALPIRYLKIDRSFIQDIRNDINDATIVSNTISLAHNLRLQTIAEGVESIEQAAHLKAAGCDQAQGYLFSPPRAAIAVEALLAKQYIGDFVGKGKNW